MTRFIFAFIIFFSSATRADEKPDVLLAEGRAHFSNGEWKKVIRAHTKAVTRIRDNKWRAVAFKEMGIAQIELKKFKAAKEAFVLALSADPTIDVNPVIDTPEAVALFRETRASLDGTLSVTTSPPGARVIIDGVDRGEAPFSGAVKIGRHRVDAQTPSGHFGTSHRDVIVRFGETTTLDLKLEPRVAFLTVIGPAGLRVTIDGVDVGVTPLLRAAVAPGMKRSLVVVKPGADPFVREINLSKGAETEVKVETAAAATVGSVGTPIPLAPSILKATARVDSWLVKPRRTRVWSYVAMGTAAALLTVGGILYWNPPTPPNTSLDAYNSGVRSYNTSVDVGGSLLVAGTATAIGAGLLFFMHRDGVPRPAITITPVIGSGAGIGLAIRR